MRRVRFAWLVWGTVFGLYVTTQTGQSAEPPIAKAGVYYVWGDESMLDLDFIRGGQIVWQWDTLQQAENTFDFSRVGTKLDLFASKGMKGTIQVNGNRKPDFLFNKVPYHPNKLSPQVWNTQGSLMYWHPYHLAQYEALLTALVAYLNNHPNKSVVLGVRLNYNAVGTEHEITTATMPPQSEWVIPSGATWYPFESSQQTTYRNDIHFLFNTKVKPSFFVFLRVNRLSGFDLASGNYGIFTTGSEMEPRAKWQEEWFENMRTWARPGTALGYAESYADSTGNHTGGPDPRWSTYAQWNYWRVLMDLDNGVSFIAVYGRDVNRATDPEYRAAYDFANKYAGFHASPAVSPGAWIAFRNGDLFKGDHTFLMHKTNSGDFTPLDLRYSPSSELGNQTQRFGAWARKLAAGKSVRVTVDSAFISSLTNVEKSISVIYLSRGNGTLEIDGFGKQFTLDVGNNNDWQRVTFNVPAGASGDSLILRAKNNAVTLHMLELERGSSELGEPPGQPVEVKVH